MSKSNLGRFLEVSVLFFIKELRADIEKLQASQFEQFKKAAKKENIEIRVDDIPEILQLIYLMIRLLSRLVR